MRDRSNHTGHDPSLTPGARDIAIRFDRLVSNSEVPFPHEAECQQGRNGKLDDESARITHGVGLSELKSTFLRLPQPEQHKLHISELTRIFAGERLGAGGRRQLQSLAHLVGSADHEERTAPMKLPPVLAQRMYQELFKALEPTGDGLRGLRHLVDLLAEHSGSDPLLDPVLVNRYGAFVLTLQRRGNSLAEQWIELRSEFGSAAAEALWDAVRATPHFAEQGRSGMLRLARATPARIYSLLEDVALLGDFSTVESAAYCDRCFELLDRAVSAVEPEQVIACLTVLPREHVSPDRYPEAVQTRLQGLGPRFPEMFSAILNRPLNGISELRLLAPIAAECGALDVLKEPTVRQLIVRKLRSVLDLLDHPLELELHRSQERYGLREGLRSEELFGRTINWCSWMATMNDCERAIAAGAHSHAKTAADALARTLPRIGGLPSSEELFSYPHAWRRCALARVELLPDPAAKRDALRGLIPLITALPADEPIPPSAPAFDCTRLLTRAELQWMAESMNGSAPNPAPFSLRIVNSPTSDFCAPLIAQLAALEESAGNSVVAGSLNRIARQLPLVAASGGTDREALRELKWAYEGYGVCEALGMDPDAFEWWLVDITMSIAARPA